MLPTPDETTQLDVRPASDLQRPPSSSGGGKIQGATVSRHHDGTDRAQPVFPIEKPPGKIGRYECRQQIGSGTFGVVYLCYDPQLKRNVAIKLRHQRTSPLDESTAELLHEAQSVARLRHPEIVAVLDTGCTEDGRGYIVYEYVDGSNLKQHIDAANFTREDAIGWIAETADALHYAHLQGLVHRDIKPANILIDRSSHIRLADFGLAKVDDSFFTDDAGRVLGTVAYMSPEQADGKSHWATSQSDIYSLGVVLYELLCGRRPFNSESSIDLLEQVKYRAVPPPRTIHDDIPKPLEQICLRAMAKEPADRFTTAADMAAELRAVLAGPPRRRSGLQYLIAALGAMVLVAAAMWILHGRQTDSIDRGTTVPSSASSAALAAAVAPRPPELEIYLQRRLQVDQFVKLRQQQVPIYTGDKVQLHVLLDKPSYAYLFWYDSHGKPTLLWPESQTDLDHQHVVSEVWSPSGAEQNGSQTKCWPVEGDPGAQLALVATAEQPLSAKEIEQFENLTFPLNDELTRPRQMLEFIHPEPPPGSSSRGLGKNPIVTSKRAIPALEPELNTRFNAYRGWLFFQDEAKP